MPLSQKVIIIGGGPAGLTAAFKNMGLGTTFIIGCSYLKSALHKRPENSLEDFYINL